MLRGRLHAEPRQTFAGGTEGRTYKDRIGVWKYPRWIEIVASLPKTATGKIQRYKLRGDAA